MSVEFEDSNNFILAHSFSTSETPFYVVNNEKSRKKNRLLLMQQIFYIESHLKRLQKELSNLE